MRERYKFLKYIILKSELASQLIPKISDWYRRELYREVDSEQFERLISLITPTQSKPIGLSRVGSVNDGGYVLCDTNSKYSALISFGVGDNIDFELVMSEVAESCDLYDHTVSHLPKSFANGNFYKIGLANFDSDSFVSLETATSKFLNRRNLLLKIDIEGGEWSSLENVKPSVFNHFEQIVIELHDLHQLHDPLKLSRYVRVLANLTANHVLVSTHANNWSPYCIIKGYPFPDTIEVTFVRLDVFDKIPPNFKNNDAIYSPNNPNAEDLVLIFK